MWHGCESRWRSAWAAIAMITRRFHQRTKDIHVRQSTKFDATCSHTKSMFKETYSILINPVPKTEKNILCSSEDIILLITQQAIIIFT